MKKKSPNNTQKPNALYATALSLVPGLGHFFAGYAISGLIWYLLFLGYTFASWQILHNLSAPTNLLLSFPILLLIWVGQLVHLLFKIYTHKGDTLLFNNLIKLLIGGVFIVLSFTFVQNSLIKKMWQVFEIPSDSMMPTLVEGDQVLLKYQNRKEAYSANDIVIFTSIENEEDFYIKRLVGLPGDHIEIKDKILYINGEHIISGNVWYTDDRIYYAHEAPRDNFEIDLEDDQYFVLGDNRDNSKDSRYFGPISYQQLQGTVKTLLISHSPKDQSVKWSRLGSHLR
jgi:signal peptidase I